jgi:hypothetical protein
MASKSIISTLPPEYTAAASLAMGAKVIHVIWDIAVTSMKTPSTTHL